LPKSPVQPFLKGDPAADGCGTAKIAFSEKIGSGNQDPKPASCQDPVTFGCRHVWLPSRLVDASGSIGRESLIFLGGKMKNQIHWLGSRLLCTGGLGTLLLGTLIPLDTLNAERFVGRRPVRERIAQRNARGYDSVNSGLYHPSYTPIPSQTPETVQIPEAVQIPETEQITKAAQIQETAKTPKAVQIPEAAQIQETAQITKAVQIPETAQTPKAVQIPEAGQTQTAYKLDTTLDLPLPLQNTQDAVSENSGYCEHVAKHVIIYILVEVQEIHERSQNTAGTQRRSGTHQAACRIFFAGRIGIGGQIILIRFGFLI